MSASNEESNTADSKPVGDASGGDTPSIAKEKNPEAEEFKNSANAFFKSKWPIVGLPVCVSAI